MRLAGAVAVTTSVVCAAGQAAAAPSQATMVTVGSVHACAIVAGKASCWGANFVGELGDGTTTSSSTPVAVNTSGVLAGKTLTEINAGNSFTCALDSAGAAYCWGSNSNGQLGNNSLTDSPVPVAVTGGHVFSQLATSSLGSFVCGIDTSGAAWCWGLNGNGQLGNNSTSQSQVPVAVTTTGVLSGKTLKAISAGTSYACALDTAGQAYCWGLNTSGQLGNNSTTQSLVPVAVTTTGVLSGKTLTAIAAGDGSTCALDSAGLAYCWGANGTGQLGNNTMTQSLMPVAVDTTGVLSGKALGSIAVGGAFACALDSTGKAYCWGDDSQGQLGSGSFISPSAVPIAVDTTGVLAGVTLTQIAAGSGTACTIDTAGNAYCWGQNGNGELGNGTSGGTVPFPVKVTGLPVGVLSITVAATATIPNIAPGSTTSGQLGTVQVSDNRGVGSWTASVSATVFTSGTHTIALTQISYWSGPATATTGTGTFTPGQATAAAAVALTTSRTAFSLTGGSAVNSASWNPTLVVAVPLATAGGTYTATITHSVA